MESYYNDEEGVVFEYSFGESDMKLLKQHSNTKRVSLYFGELEIPDLDFLSDLHFFKHLSIANYPMVTSFPSLPDLVNLEYVSLWGCKRLTDISNVLSIPNLKFFSITSMPITIQDLECIAKKPGLEKMYGIFESKRKEDEFQSMPDQYGVISGWKHS